MGAYEIVQKLEAMRKQKNVYGTLMLLCALSPILCNILPISALTPVISCGCVLFGVVFFAGKAGKITKEYKKLYKESFVVSVLNEVFENVIYDYERGFESSYVNHFALTRLGNRFSSEDYLRASYKGINFEQADVMIQYHTSGKNSHTTTYFKGRMFAFHFPYKSVTSVQVFSEHYPYRGTPNEGFKMNKIQMESQRFNKMFDVRAYDEMDAFYVLTPHMMERLEYISQHFNHIAMHFHGNKLYVGIHTSGDAFDGNPNRKVSYVEEREAALRDARVITEIIDALGMMQVSDSTEV